MLEQPRVRGQAELLAIFGVLLLVLLVVASAGVLTPELTSRTVLIVCIAVVLLIPIAWRVFQGKFDGLEPLFWLNGHLFLLFVIEPIALLAYGITAYRTWSILPTFDDALLIALVGCAALSAGYVVPLGRRIARALPALPESASGSTLLAYLTLLLAVAAAAYLALPRTSGLFAGVQAPEDTTAYLYQAPLMIFPATLLFLHVALETRKRAPMIGTIAGAMLSGVVFLPGGQRSYVFIGNLALVIYILLRANRRLGWRTLLVGGLAVYFLILPKGATVEGPSSVPTLSGLVQKWTYSWSHPAEALQHELTGADTEMFETIAAELYIVPSALGFHPGYTVYAIAIHPIPRPLWPGKPRIADDVMDVALFSRTGYRAGTGGPAFSFLGDLFYDAGYASVLAGALLTGMFWRAAWEYVQANVNNKSVKLVYAALLPCAFVVVRYNIEYGIVVSLWFVMPVVLGVFVARATAAVPTVQAPARY